MSLKERKAKIGAEQKRGGDMNTIAVEKEAHGRVVEFRVAPELCRRKMFVTLTMEKDRRK